MSEPTIDAYERVTIPSANRSNAIFLYAAHYLDANYLLLGAGMESVSKLQRAHLGGPQVHELHVPLISDWLFNDARVMLNDQPSPRHHPLSSNYTVDLPIRLQQTDTMSLTLRRYFMLADNVEVPKNTVQHFANAVHRVGRAAFGHPLDWDVRRVEFNDGRFIWMAFDAKLDKIRIGMGFYNEANSECFGSHAYAVGLKDAAIYSIFHYTHPTQPIFFPGIPPRWPSGLKAFIFGAEKQEYARAFLALADAIWPGQVCAPQ